MRSLATALAATLVVAAIATAAGVPFWGAKSSLPADTDPATLEPGQFVWLGDAVASGPLVVVVSVREQRAYVYRNGVRIGVTTVSTGKRGHETPTGVFSILQKDADHHSKKYNDAPMPYAERLTWDGVALHAGGLPGYPSSHGCVHLPSAFARLLFDVSSLGMTVVVASDATAPQDVVHPAALSPVDARTGAPDELPRLGPDEAYRWQPESSPDGPLTILMSRADERVVVFRGGKEIGRARLTISDPGRPLGTHAFVMLDGTGRGPSPIDPKRPAHRWSAVALPGYAGAGAAAADPAAVSRLRTDPAFAAALYAILAPGASLVVTDAPVLEQTTGPRLGVLNGDPPEA